MWRIPGTGTKSTWTKDRPNPQTWLIRPPLRQWGICFAILQSIVIYVKITDTKPGA